MAASASASASTSTSTSTAADSNNNYCYDVFINHRGPDVKKTFASHLYRRLLSHGLTAFLDQEELQTGRNFDSQIKEAIRTASVHIAIFSPKYAESEWCLKELVLMLESGAPIIPVFHQVKPAEVRWTQGEGIYAGALHILEKKRTHDSQPRHDTSTIEKWRNTLSRVADISGLDLEAFNGDEGELLDKVVEVVLKKGVKVQLSGAKYPTGLDEKVTEFEMTVLSQQNNGRVGITGLGGVGKTTLAIELFNRKSANYSKSYFLVDVRENAKNSLHSILKGLFNLDLHIDNHLKGKAILKKHLSSSQVFIVLDDVDHVDQVDALLPVDVLKHGSLILITPRHKDVLASSGVQEPSIYTLSGLNREHSRELFCSHAFCQPRPLCGFENLVDEFVRACHGLPLSLKVVGALLSGRKDKSDWEDHLDSLQKTLPHDIQKSLKISYDALQKEEQYMFLDVACFFTGHNKGTVIRIWNASGWKGSIGFQSLLDKCLVELDVVALNSHGKKIETRIRMHDHLRDLGRDLGKYSGLPCIDLGKYSGLPCRDLAKLAKLPSRLWRGTKNDYLLQQSFHEAAADVRGIRMRSKTPNHMDASSSDDDESASSSDDDDDDESASFSSFKMEKLQLLDIDIEADRLECILRVVHLPNLLWLRWRECTSLPPWIPLKKLRVLEVEGYNLETLWQDGLQAPLQLRELRVEYSFLSYIPKSIGQLKHLERIVLYSLRWLNNIFEIPEEFCHLRSLKHLQLCLPMRSLPDSFGNLTLWQDGLQAPLQLRELRVEYSALRYIPKSIGQLKHLERIVLCTGWGSKSIFEIPEEFCHLRSLKHLQLSISLMRSLPDTFGNLTNLEYIDLTYCTELKRLPNSFGSLTKLKYLDLSCCYNLTLSSGSFGNISTLEYINLTGCHSIEVLPSQIAHQRSLEKLDLDLPKLKEWPSATGEPSGLEKLVLKSRLLETLPSSFSLGLWNLKHLELRGCRSLKRLPDSFGNITNLEYIDLSSCRELKRLPNSFGSLSKLKYLDLSCCSHLTLSSGSFGNISTLEYINLTDCDSIEVLPSQIAHQRSLEKLDLDLPNLKEWPSATGEPSGLEKFVLKSPLLETLPSSFGLGLWNLKHLELRGCRSLKRLPDSFGNITNLVYIDLSSCRELKRLPNSFGSLSKLKYLDLSCCSHLTLSSGSFGNISTLEYINLTDCDSIEVLPSQIAHQRSLEKLDLDLPNLKEWPSATGEPSSLEKFVLKSPLLETLPSSFVLGLWNLKHLELRGCRSLKRLPDSVRLLNQLTELTAEDCSLRELHFKTFEGESETPSTESTGKGRSSSLGTSFSPCLLGLQHLKLHHTEISEVLFPTSVCPNLQHLDIQYCNDLVEVGTLPKALITLKLRNCSKLRKIEVGTLPKALITLKLRNCSKLRKIEGLCGLAKLQTLNIGGLKKVEELPSIETLVSLEVLKVHDCVKIKSIQGLAQLTKLRELDVSGCPELEELPSVGHIRSLLLFRASEFMKVKSTLWVVQLTRLQELDVSYFTELEDLAGVGHLKSLEVLRASVCVKLKSIPGLEQLTGLRELNVSYCYELEELESVENLKSLEKLRAWFCVKLKSIHGLVQLTQLRELEVSGCSELGELPGIEHLRSLEMLRASNCVKLKSIRRLEQLEKLRELEVSGCSELGELQGIEHLRSLEMLRACNCVKLKSIHGLVQLTQLRELEVSGCSELGELPGIEHLRSLEMLRASNCVKLKSIRSLEQLEKLRELEVSRCSELGELPGIEHLRSLEMLRACNCVKLKRIQGPTLLERLAELDVSGCSELEELPSVEHLTSLEKLRARNCVKLKRLQGPARLTRLAELDVSGCCELEELLSIE